MVASNSGGAHPRAPQTPPFTWGGSVPPHPPFKSAAGLPIYSLLNRNPNEESIYGRWRPTQREAVGGRIPPHVNGGVWGARGRPPRDRCNHSDAYSPLLLWFQKIWESIDFHAFACFCGAYGEECGGEIIENRQVFMDVHGLGVWPGPFESHANSWIS